MSKKLSFTQEELNAIIAGAVAQALAQKPTKSAGKGKGKAKLVEFTKHDGTKVMTTEKQAAAWAKYRDGYVDRGTKEENLAKWKVAREAYKPTKALKDAIKKDRTKVTLEVAKSMGFVGTKLDLKALKDDICK